MELWQIIRDMAKTADAGWGQMYYHVMPQLIRSNNYYVGAEIGVAFGGHSEAMLQKTKVSRLYSIDPYQPDYFGTDGYVNPETGLDFNKQEYEALYVHALTRLKHPQRSIFIRKSSTAAWAIMKDVQLDFVFIDAKHTFEDLYTDIYLWEKRVRTGGMICGHDYGHESYPGIKQAVDAHFSNVTLHDGYVWSVKKTW